MNIVFMGTPDFAVPSLETLLAHGHRVVAVVTAPDKPRGRGQQVSFTPVKETALRHDIPVLQPASLKDPQFASDLSAVHPDLFVVVAFRILPKEIFKMPTHGSFNLHASLLPKYRGAAPINWALINGEKETGVTSFFLKETVDTGSVLLKASTPVSESMTAGELHDVLSELGAQTVLKTVEMIAAGTATPQPQDDTQATPAPKIFKETCRIAWDRPSVELHNFIRGLSPHPAAWTTHQGKVIKIYRTSLTDGSKTANVPGSILIVEKRLFVATNDRRLEILEVQQEGKKKMTAEEFLRGYRFGSGALFE